MTTIDFKTCRASKAGNIITPKCRMSFPVLFDPQTPPNQPTGKKRYSVALLIPSGCDLTLLKEAAKAAAKEQWGEKVPQNVKNPLLDAGKYTYNGYEEGMTLLRPTTLNKPGIVNAKGENVTDESEVYPGRWCVASLRAYAYDVSGNRGISFGLQNIQLLDHDEPLGGRARAEDEFAPVEGSGDAKPNSADDFLNS
jgi:hypothetical protein